MRIDLSTVKTQGHIAEVSPYSRCCCMIESLRLDCSGDEICNAKGSGFFWVYGNKLYLVTNWHVVTGINPDTNMQLGGFTPNGMRINFFAERPLEEDRYIGPWILASMKATIELSQVDPIEGWHIHPSGKSVDVAVLEIAWDGSSGFELPCLNRTGIEVKTCYELGDDVFILGFPEGSTFDRRLPIWKRGSVATDPDLDQAGRPQYFVDTIGNAGLSGAPVVHISQNIIPLATSTDEGYVISKRVAFAGIYAGRLGDSGIQSQIGRVFRARVLDELFAAI